MRPATILKKSHRTKVRIVSDAKSRRRVSDEVPFRFGFEFLHYSFSTAVVGLFLTFFFFINVNKNYIDEIDTVVTPPFEPVFESIKRSVPHAVAIMASDD